MPKLTIIIPVFKAEPYLHRCIDSILAQTFTDWELLLIDDGSPDRSGEICDEYAKKDKRIRVFHKENGGVSSARNLGLENMQGEWVTFVDADDYILPDFIKGLYKPITDGERVDFVQGGCHNVKGEKIVNVNQSYENFIGDDPGYVFKRFRGLTVSKLFSLENVNRGVNGRPLRFDEKMRIAEDMAFTLDYLLTVKRYAFVEELGYCYRIDNMRSATKSTRQVQYEEDLHSFKHLYASIQSYAVKHKLPLGDCVLRYKQLGNKLIGTILSLYKCGKNKDERLMHLHNDFTEQECKMLHYSDVSLAKRLLVMLLLRGKGRLGDLLISIIIKARLCLR